MFCFGVGLAGTARDSVSVEGAPIGLIDAVSGFLLTERLRMRDDREASIAAEAAAQLAAASADAANERHKELLESTVGRGGTGGVAGSRALNYQRKATPQDQAAAVECFSGIRGAGLETLASLGLLTDPASQVPTISRIPQKMLSTYEEIYQIM